MLFRLDVLRRRADLPEELFALPGPLIRQVVHLLDRIGRSDRAITRSVALSETVARRPGYFQHRTRCRWRMPLRNSTACTADAAGTCSPSVGSMLRSGSTSSSAQ